MPDFDPKSIPILDDIIEKDTAESKDSAQASDDVDVENLQQEDNFDLFLTASAPPDAPLAENGIDNFSPVDEESYREDSAENNHHLKYDETPGQFSAVSEFDHNLARTTDIATTGINEADENDSIEYITIDDISLENAALKEIKPDDVESYTATQNTLESYDADYDEFADEKPEDEFESALINYHRDEENDPEIDIQHNEADTANTSAIDHVQTDPMQQLVDDIVLQIMPDLEQRLKSLVKQALKEKLPKDIKKHIKKSLSTDN